MSDTASSDEAALIKQHNADAACAGDWEPKDTSVAGTRVHLALIYPDHGLAGVDPRPETDEEHVHRDTVELPAKRDRRYLIDRVN